MSEPAASDKSRMHLYWSSRSPFVRKVMVMAHEVGVVDRLYCERVLVAAAVLSPVVMAANPLNKIPTLVLENGDLMFGSDVICQYFDTLHDGERLFPADGEDRWRTLRGQALGDGMMENIVLRLAERGRPEEFRSPVHDDAYKAKVACTLDWIEGNMAKAIGDRFTVADIAIGSALAHIDFRFDVDQWRFGRPKLAQWFEAFSLRPSVLATRYEEVY